MEKQSDENARFYELVRKMRTTQQKYFKTRDLAVLEESKTIEKQVERGLEWIRKNNASVNWSLTSSVRKMLDAQHAYYASRTSSRLTKAKSLEKEVDDLIKDFFDNQLALFP